ncbi:hypothetical protein [Nocardia yunnanensis]|uniref:hypothetical protein n=1 Tax=Nocardia yunnanensis TaxID=2382165 RepID=UPI0013C43F90|nr:hypothetical protein [Nocardia yunnanensis]
MDFLFALTLVAAVMLAAVLSASRTGCSSQHRAGLRVADIEARLAAERERTDTPVGRW